MEIKKTCWLECFDEACQDILEDAFLLDALAMYVTVGGEFMRNERAEYFPQVFRRLCGYLSQHAWDLHNLEEQLRPNETCMPAQKADHLPVPTSLKK